MKKQFEPLPKSEVIKAIEGGRPSRIPLVRAKWWGEGLIDQYGERLREFDRFPEDVCQLFIPNPVNPERMNLSWTWQHDGAKDGIVVIDDWAKLDEFIAKIPVPEQDRALAELVATAEKAHRDGRYLLFGWWNLFFERPWMLRGMQNLMIDYYEYPEQIHRLHAAMAATYIAYLRAAKRLLDLDGFFTSDDLGHQTGPMMSPDTFHEIIYPYYVKIGVATRELGAHFWLHSCGDNSLLLADLIAAGVDVFHPVQKHTMDEAKTVADFGGKISFLAGIDVQHTLQEQTPASVRDEVRFVIDTFDRPEGRLLMAAGNGIVSGTPFENIEAFLDEALEYGSRRRERYRCTD